jgi:hypothetical protein
VVMPFTLTGLGVIRPAPHWGPTFATPTQGRAQGVTGHAPRDGISAPTS